MNSPRTLLATRSGLSVTDLLVAILVLVVLALLSLGVLQRSGELARNAQCTANLRAVGLGALQFMHDRGGTLLPSKHYVNPSFRADKPGFRDYVGVSSTNIKVNAPEFQVDSAFTCPTVKREYPGMYPSYLNRCYVANFYAFLDDPENLDELPEDRKPASPDFYGRLANVPAPSRMWMFADPCVREPNPTNISTYSKPDYYKTGSTYRVEFHRRRTNAVFFDGHVEPLTRADFYQGSRKYFWGIATATD